MTIAMYIYAGHAARPNPTSTTSTKEAVPVQLPQVITAMLPEEAAIASETPGEANEIPRQPQQEVQPNHSATAPTKEAVTVQLPQAATAMPPETDAATSEYPKQLSRQPNLAATRVLGG